MIEIIENANNHYGRAAFKKRFDELIKAGYIVYELKMIESEGGFLRAMLISPEVKFVEG